MDQLHNNLTDNGMLAFELISEVSVGCDITHGLLSTASLATKGEK